jgi:hypothetical protein
VLATITWFAFLSGTIGRYEDLYIYGSYGSNQAELFQIYGGTLRSEELAEAFIEERLAPIISERNIIIANNPIFAKYGITDLTEFFEWYFNYESYESYKGYGGVLSQEETLDRYTMEAALTMATLGKQNSREWVQNSLEYKESRLNAIGTRYIRYSANLEFRMQDKSPIIARAAERILAVRNNSLINDYLMDQFPPYAAITGVFALVAVIVLIMPLLIVDRSHKVNLLQYSSAVGRKIFHFQFVASIISAFVLSVVLTVLSFIPFIALASEYWDVSIMSDGAYGMWLYNITFDQFVFIIAGMIIILCVGATCVTFILARFSMNMVNVAIKTIPVGIALSAVCFLSVNKALSEYNIVFRQIFFGKFDVPEVIICFVIGVFGVIAAVVITAREKRVDVM